MKTKKSAEIDKTIRANFRKMSYREIGKLVGLDSENVRSRCRKMKLTGESKKKLPLEKQVEADIVNSQIVNRLKDKNQKYSFLMKENEKLQKLLEVNKTIEDINTYQINVNGANVGDATAFAILSDWHFWETVLPERVDGLNDFNTNIAKKRANTCFANIVRLLKREQRDSKIDTLVLALLGDFVNNQINSGGDDNAGAVAHEALDVQNALCSGIEFILANTDVELIIPCTSGNHGRITEKLKTSNEAGHSIEYFMYHQMANYFRNEKRVKFLITEGYFVYLNISDYVVRFHHGHNIKYGGGVGGIFIPAFKAISQWNKARVANLDVFGHFHQVKDGGNFISNGSLVGYNGYAVSIKADFEKPKQIFFLINHKRKEKTTTCPIFLE